MKRIIIALIFLAGCNTFIVSGTYVSNWSTGYSKVEDTLIIHTMPGDNCTVIRHMAIMRGSKVWSHHETWSGTYHESDHTIDINNNGRTLFLKSGEIQMGKAVYKKL